MTQHFSLSSEQDYAWLIVVPKRQEFTQPKFHFGERVKWCTEAKSSSWGCQTGRIIGIHFIASHGWTYLINLDQEGQAPDTASGEQSIAEPFLQLVQDSASLRRQLKPAADWLLTNQAAARLGLSPEQLRKLRRKGLFKPGHHCRDSSVPGSGLPRWQWHVERCSQALESPSAKRSLRRKY